MAPNIECPVLVYDVGGSHVSAAVCHGADYRLGPVFSAHHPAAQTSDAFVGLLHSLGVEAAAGFELVTGATLAIPSPFDFQAGVSLMRHKLPYLYGVDLRQALAGYFGWEPCDVSFLNDADAFLLGEIGAGAARRFARAVGITVGTGTGSAFAVDGQLVTEGSGVPRGGEIWDIPYENGIVEDFLSSRAISGNYKRRTGNTREVAELAAAAPDDPAAKEVFVEFGQHLGRMLEMILAGFAPEIVVLGGGISHAAHLFLPAAQSQLNDMAPQLRVAELQDRAALVGCGVARFNGGNGSPLSVGVGSARTGGA
ncbi:MAG: ROK family protein [Terracidiphilus sp.]